MVRMLGWVVLRVVKADGFGQDGLGNGGKQEIVRGSDETRIHGGCLGHDELERIDLTVFGNGLEGPLNHFALLFIVLQKAEGGRRGVG